MNTETSLDLNLAIGGMSCGHCVARVRQALQMVPGVTVRVVTIGHAEIVVTHAAAGDAVLAALLDAGHAATIEASKPSNIDQRAGAI